ncbi:MAG: sialate O-acetylesterase [Mangrovibacterium sp.]
MMLSVICFLLTLSSPSDYQVIQRFSKDSGNMVVSGFVEKARPTSFEIKITGTGLQGIWEQIQTTVTGSFFEGKKVLPAGGWYKIEIRALRGKTILAESHVDHVGIGEVFVVAGQSNSANHGEERQMTVTGLVSSFKGDGWQLANDPQPGADGDGGSFMPAFGDAIAEKFGVPIGIVACGVGGTSVREWLPRGTTCPIPPYTDAYRYQHKDGCWTSKGVPFENMISRIIKIGKEGFRAVLWHQGESDADQIPAFCTLPGYLYWQYMDRLIMETRKATGHNSPWFTAQATYHNPTRQETDDIRAAQKALWESKLTIEGPDTDQLKGNLRDLQGEGVHFSKEGLKKHALLWFEKVCPWLEEQLGDGECPLRAIIPSN